MKTEKYLDVVIAEGYRVNSYEAMFIHAWFNYYVNWMAREFMFKMR